MNTRILRKCLIAIVAICMELHLAAGAKRCPNFCKCDLYNDRNRADCSGKRLIHANIDLPLAVEILDFSFNDIAIIDDKCLENYYFLINLTITHNDIHTIYLDAFIKLPQLANIDLSYNRLEYLDERLFEANHQLDSLLLEGNKFTTLPNGPLLRSTSLKILNLRNAAVNYVGTELLTALPQLNELDLSQNLMITLNAVAFNSLKQLKTLNLDENPWTCDKALRRALAIIQKRGVNIIISDCKFIDNVSDSQVSMLERMELMGSKENEFNETLDFEFDEQPLNWRSLNNQTQNQTEQQQQHQQQQGNAMEGDEDDAIYFENYIKVNDTLRSPSIGITVDEDVCDGSQVSLCRRYRKCLEKMSHLLIQDFQSKVFRETQNYTQSDLELSFFLGMAIGIAVVMLILSCAFFCKNCCKPDSKKRPASVEAQSEEPTYVVRSRPRTLAEGFRSSSSSHQPIYMEIGRASASPALQSTTAPPLRRSRRRPPTQPQRNASQAMVRRESDNFIARLFGRPSRHQYYRTINENTATLIRRLSRSNLFNNRLSQHFLDRENSRQSATPTNNNASAPTTPDEHITMIPALRRPETPPPNYVDVVNKTRVEVE